MKKRTCGAFFILTISSATTERQKTIFSLNFLECTATSCCDRKVAFCGSSCLKSSCSTPERIRAFQKLIRLMIGRANSKWNIRRRVTVWKDSAVVAVFLFYDPGRNISDLGVRFG